jgi:hypothetical protein
MKSMSIVRLLGHSFGDGYIHKTKSYFIYTNGAKELLDEVSANVAGIFGNVPSCERTSIGGTPQIQFSATVGKKLDQLGAPRGSKTKQATVIPSGIIQGKEDAKADFLGA